MGERRNANRMERRILREYPKVRRSARMSNLHRKNAPISGRKGPQQSHHGETEDMGGCQAQRSSS